MDDDEAQREVLMEVLELEGVRVFAASSADEAVRLLQESPDVVLMDLHGVEVEPVRAALVRLARRPALLIVSGDLRLAEHAQSLGADGWLAKPYELDQLLGVVSDAMDRREGAAPAP
ncbi:MAG: response regulator [Myxococcaceae bacterium]